MRGADTSPAPRALHHLLSVPPVPPVLLPWTLVSSSNAWNSAARTILVVAGPALGQSVALAGSASCSPRKFGPPVHWFVSTTSRRCVAVVAGMSNERDQELRRDRAWCRGRERVRGARVDRRVPGLGSVQPAFSVLALHAWIANCRRAVKRFCPLSMALTWTRLTERGCEPARSTVTCVPFRTSVCRPSPAPPTASPRCRR